jgi:hypothetical protein
MTVPLVRSTTSFSMFSLINTVSQTTEMESAVVWPSAKSGDTGAPATRSSVESLGEVKMDVNTVV